MLNTDTPGFSEVLWGVLRTVVPSLWYVFSLALFFVIVVSFLKFFIFISYIYFGFIYRILELLFICFLFIGCRMEEKSSDKWDLSRVAVDALGAAMLVTIILDLWRLFLGPIVPLPEGQKCLESGLPWFSHWIQRPLLDQFKDLTLDLKRNLHTSFHDHFMVFLLQMTAALLISFLLGRLASQWNLWCYHLQTRMELFELLWNSWMVPLLKFPHGEWEPYNQNTSLLTLFWLFQHTPKPHFHCGISITWSCAYLQFATHPCSEVGYCNLQLPLRANW